MVVHHPICLIDQVFRHVLDGQLVFNELGRIKKGRPQILGAPVSIKKATVNQKVTRMPTPGAIRIPCGV